MKRNIIFLIGPAGSGKSSLGKIICENFNCLYLDKDIICNTFISNILEKNGFDSGDRDGCDFYKNELMPLEYKTILDIANDNISLGKSVVIDAPFCAYFNNKYYLNEVRDLYKWEDEIQIITIHVSVDEDIHYNRIVSRNNPRDKWKLENWKEYISSLKENQCKWIDGIHLYYNNNKDILDIESIEKSIKISSLL